MGVQTSKKINEAHEPLISCFETEDGVMNLQFDSIHVKLTKRHFVEFSVLVHKLGQIIIDEMVEEKLSKVSPIHLGA